MMPSLITRTDIGRLCLPTHNQSYSVTGGGTKTASTSGTNSATDTQGVFQYTATGLGTTPVYVALVTPSDIQTGTNGQISFLSSQNAGQADLNAGDGEITVVNGVPTGGVSMTATPVTPNNGTVTFSVNSTTAGDAIPVVFSAADGNNVLEVNTTKTGSDVYGAPTEAFGDGGEATWTSPAAATGVYTGEVVNSVNKTAKTFQADSGTPSGGYTFSYAQDGNTYYYVQDAQGNSTQLSQAQFANYLSSGDVLTINYNDNGPSTFTYTTDVPAAPTGVTAAYEAATSSKSADVKLSWTASPNPDVTDYNVYQYTVKNGAVDTTTKTTVDTAVTGTTDTVAAPSSPGSYVYTVRANTVSAGSSDESDYSNTVTVPNAPAAAAPQITGVTINPSSNVSGGTYTAGSATITYKDNVSCGAAAGADFKYTNSAGSGPVTGTACAQGGSGTPAAGTTNTLVITFPANAGTGTNNVNVAAPANGDQITYTVPSFQTTGDAVYAGSSTNPTYAPTQTLTFNGTTWQ